MSSTDNALRAERSRIGKLARVKSGQWHGGPPPYGYYIHAKHLHIQPQEAHWVKEIFNRIINGSTIAEVKLHLEDNEVFTRRRNKLWSLGSVAAILRNTHYKGYYDYTDRRTMETVRVTSPLIIDELLWNAVQHRQQIERRRQQIEAIRKHYTLLRGLLYCGHCGLLLASRIKPSKRESVYYCPYKERVWAKIGRSDTPWQRGTGCGITRSLSIPATDALIWHFITDHFLTDKKLAYSPAFQNGTADPDLSRLRADLRQALNIQSRLYTEYQLGTVTEGLYQSSQQHLQERINTLSAEIVTVERGVAEAKARQAQLAWMDQFIGRELGPELLTLEEQRLLFAGLISRINVKYVPEDAGHELEVVLVNQAETVKLRLMISASKA